MNSHGVNRHSYAIIDREAIRHNYRYLKALAGDGCLIAVIKADAYGHGATEVAHALAGDADAFAVAAVGEAMALREAGITQKIIVMGGFISAAELRCCIDLELDPVLHHDFHLDTLLAADAANGLEVWIKLDTGMGRLGFELSRARQVIESLETHTGLGQIRLMTHFASADDVDSDFTSMQLERTRALELDHYEWGIANSAGILGWDAAKRQWARAGIALYGADPMSDRDQKTRNLKPAMTMKTRILAVNSHAAGDVIGYANTYRCPQDMKIAVAAAGYADGFPRHKVETAQVEVQGRLYDVVGRVSMDMITIDLRGLDHVRVGEPVELWGEHVAATEVAAAAGTTVM